MAIGDNIPAIFGDLAAVSMRSNGDIQYFLDLIQNRDADQLLALRNLESGGIPAPIGSPFDQNMSITGGDALTAMGMIVDNAFTQPSSGGDVTKARIDLAAQELFNNSPGTIPDRSIISSVADDIEVSPNQLASAYNSINQSVMADMEEDALRQSYDLNGAAISPFIDTLGQFDTANRITANPLMDTLGQFDTANRMFEDPSTVGPTGGGRITRGVPEEFIGTGGPFASPPPPSMFTSDRTPFPETLLPNIMEPNIESGMLRPSSLFSDPDPASMFPVDQYGRSMTPEIMPPPHTRQRGAFDVFSPESARYVPRREGEIAAYPPMPVGEFDKAWQDYYASGGAVPEDTRGLLQDIGKFPFPWSIGGQTVLPPSPSLPNLTPDLSSLEYIKQMERAIGLTPTEENDPMLARILAREAAPVPTATPVPTDTTVAQGDSLAVKADTLTNLQASEGAPAEQPVSAAQPMGGLGTGTTRETSFLSGGTESDMSNAWKTYLTSVVPNYYVQQVSNIYAERYQPFLGNYLLDVNRRNAGTEGRGGFLNFMQQYKPETSPVLDWPKLQPSYNKILDLADLQDINSRYEWATKNPSLNESLGNTAEVIAIALARWHTGEPGGGSYPDRAIHNSLTNSLEKHIRESMMTGLDEAVSPSTINANWLKKLSVADPERWGR